MLCKRHGTGIKPAVDDLRHTVHGLAAVRAVKGHFIDIRTMKLDISAAFDRRFLLIPARLPMDSYVRTLALPDI